MFQKTQGCNPFKVIQQGGIYTDIYVAIDDTDSLEEGSTGESANQIRLLIEERGWGETRPVTRHQLLIHPDIPYTSHNSSMCFTAELQEDKLEAFIEAAAEVLRTTSAPGSDPGLCVAVGDSINNRDSLIAFGLKAKIDIVDKEAAYTVADQCNLHLSEHGGTGQGIIGALAGVALRLTGNDGRFQGKMKLQEAGQRVRAGDLLLRPDIEEIRSLDGYVLKEEEMLVLGEKIKTVLLDYKRILMVYAEEDGWHTCINQQLKKY